MNNSFFNPEDKLSERRKEEQSWKTGQMGLGTILPKRRNYPDSGKTVQIQGKREKRANGSGDDFTQRTKWPKEGFAPNGPDTWKNGKTGN